MGAFLSKPVIKNILLALPVLLIGGICSALGTWDYKEDSFFIFKVVALTIVSVIYIVLLAYYATKETNLNKTSRLQKRRNQAYEEIMTGLISVCKQSAADISIIVHNITTNGQIDLNIWSFDKAINWVCREIYNLLCVLHGNSKDFAVGYVRLKEDDKPKTIYLSAYANENMQKPTIYGRPRCYGDEHSYYDAELFRRNQADIEILMGHEKIDECFAYSNKSSKRKNKFKYNQYIAIPVFCSDSKMIGLLEIVCLNETILSETEKEMEEIAKKYFCPYAYFILLLHKLEKALVAVPN